MAARPTVKRTLIGPEVMVAFAVIATVYLARLLPIQPFQVPAYLLIVAYDGVERAVPAVVPYYQIGFPVFLYTLAVIGGAAARWLAPGSSRTVDWYRAIGGVCLLLGAISLLFGAYIGGPLIAPADNPTPLAITGATGVILLVASWWLLRRAPNEWALPGTRDSD